MERTPFPPKRRASLGFVVRSMTREFRGASAGSRETATEEAKGAQGGAFRNGKRSKARTLSRFARPYASSLALSNSPLKAASC